MQPILDFFKPLISFLVKIFPICLIWIVLTVLFIIMPNTKVKFGSALVAGIIVRNNSSAYSMVVY